MDCILLKGRIRAFTALTCSLLQLMSVPASGQTTSQGGEPSAPSTFEYSTSICAEPGRYTGGDIRSYHNCNAMKIGSGEAQHLPGEQETCPDGQMMVGMSVEDDQTAMMCEPLPTPAPQVDCAAATVGWADGALNCAGPAVFTPNGLSTVATDSSAPDTGSATFQCTGGSFVLVSGSCN